MILAAEFTGCLPKEVWLGAIGVGVVETGFGLSEGLAVRWTGLLEEVACGEKCRRAFGRERREGGGNQTGLSGESLEFTWREPSGRLK